MTFLKLCSIFMIHSLHPHRDNPPGQSTSVATQELLRITEANPGGLEALDPIKDLHLRDLDLVEKFRERDALEGLLDQYSCLNCPNLLEHVSSTIFHSIKVVSMSVVSQCRTFLFYNDTLSQINPNTNPNPTLP